MFLIMISDRNTEVNSSLTLGRRNKLSFGDLGFEVIGIH